MENRISLVETLAWLKEKILMQGTLSFRFEDRGGAFDSKVNTEYLTFNYTNSGLITISIKEEEYTFLRDENGTLLNEVEDIHKIRIKVYEFNISDVNSIKSFEPRDSDFDTYVYDSAEIHTCLFSFNHEKSFMIDGEWLDCVSFSFHLDSEKIIKAFNYLIDNFGDSRKDLF